MSYEDEDYFLLFKEDLKKIQFFQPQEEFNENEILLRDLTFKYKESKGKLQLANFTLFESLFENKKFDLSSHNALKLIKDGLNLDCFFDLKSNFDKTNYINLKEYNEVNLKIFEILTCNGLLHLLNIEKSKDFFIGFYKDRIKSEDKNTSICSMKSFDENNRYDWEYKAHFFLCLIDDFYFQDINVVYMENKIDLEKLKLLFTLKGINRLKDCHFSLKLNKDRQSASYLYSFSKLAISLKEFIKDNEDLAKIKDENYYSILFLLKLDRELEIVNYEKEELDFYEQKVLPYLFSEKNYISNFIKRSEYIDNSHHLLPFNENYLIQMLIKMKDRQDINYKKVFNILLNLPIQQAICNKEKVKEIINIINDFYLFKNQDVESLTKKDLILLVIKVLFFTDKIEENILEKIFDDFSDVEIKELGINKEDISLFLTKIKQQKFNFLDFCKNLNAKKITILRDKLKVNSGFYLLDFDISKSTKRQIDIFNEMKNIHLEEMVLLDLYF